MIPILFKADATDFSTFGIGALSEALTCEVTEERNGGFECKLTYPSSGRLYSEILKDRIIKAKPMIPRRRRRSVFIKSRFP